MIDQSKSRKFFRISGMTCRKCETRIESGIKPIPSVTHCQADYVKGILQIDYEGESLRAKEILAALSDAGYEGVEIGRLRKICREIVPLIITGIVIFILYRAGKMTGWLNKIPEIREDMSYPFLFIIGLLTSLHCLGMCGGINLTQSGLKSRETDRRGPVRRSLNYNTGRIVSYTLLGGIVGGLGSVLYLSLTMQTVISIAAGALMIIMGLNMLGLLSALKILIPVLPASLSIKISRQRGKASPFLVGVLNGFMPCGPLQSMQIYALSTGSILKGALSMFLFSAGTVPLMFAFGSFSLFFNRRRQKNVMRVSALLIVILGWGMISRGLNLNGVSLIPRSSEEVVEGAAVARIEGDVQIVNSKVSPSSYEPIIVQAGIPVRWNIEAGPGDITGCNNAIVSRDFGIRQKLSEGSTLIEFTPEEGGNFGFTCWMGMISSRILVVEDLTAFDPELLNSPPDSEPARVNIKIPDYEAENIGYSEVSGEEQSAVINIDESGFSPSIIVMERNRKMTWVFNTGETDEINRRLIFPSYNAQIDLTGNDSQTIELFPEGDFYFYSWKGDFLGFVITVEDLDSVSDEEILKRIASYLSE